MAQRWVLIANRCSAGGQTTLTGVFTVLWGDGPAGRQERAYLLVEEQGTGQRTRLVLDDQALQAAGGLLALNGRRVTVTGAVTAPAVAGGRPSALAAQTVRLAAGTPQPSTAAAAAAVSGATPWLTILCKFADVATEPTQPSYYEGLMAGAYPGMSDYWREVSNNAVDLAGSTTLGRWYPLPGLQASYMNGPDPNWGKIVDDCTTAADADVYFPGYWGLNLVLNAGIGCCAWGGQSGPITRDGVTKSYATTWIPSGAQPHVLIAHEMGHGYGIPHTRSGYEANSSCDRFPTNHPLYGCVAQHVISYHKDIPAWIPAAQRFTFAGGVQTITLERSALPQTANYRMAVIPVAGSTTRFFTVEARRKAGYDATIVGDAVVIHEVDTTRGDPAWIVDQDNDGDWLDDGAMWLPGETYTNAADRFSVTVNAATATGYPVTIADLTQTITFDDKSGQNQALTGQYPAGVIDWGTGVWWHSAPWGKFTTKSVSFSSASRTSGSFNLISPQRLIKLDAYNGGSGSTTVTLTCTGASPAQPNKTATLAAKALQTIDTGWTATCTGVTIASTNGWNTNFDNLVMSTSASADTTPPTATAVAPADGATGVAPSTNVSVTFSEPMDPASISAATFTLVDPTLTLVAAVVTYDAAGRTATLNPNTDLRFGTAYTATVKGGIGGVKDVAGNPLAADKIWRFTTAAAYTLSVTKGGNGGGTVTSSPAGIACGSDCTEDYAASTAVALTAVAAPGSAFVSWSGACTSVAPCSVTMDSAKSVTATFDQLADLSISMTDTPDPVLVGQNVTYTVTVTNGGPGPVAGASILDVLPQDTQFVSATAPCIPVHGSVSCNLPELANGATLTMTIVFQATAPATITNTAVLGGIDRVDPNPANNSVTVTTSAVGSADLRLTMSQPPDPVYVGQNVPYTLTVTNLGPAAASMVTLRDVVPTDGATLHGEFVPGGSDPRCGLANGLISCDLSPLASGAATTVRIVLRPTVAGNFPNVAEVVSGREIDPTPNNVAVATNTAVLRPVTLTVTKSGTGTGTVSSSPAGITCGLDCNESYTPGTVVTLTATPDPGSTLVSWNGACDGPTLSCNVGMYADTSVAATFAGTADLSLTISQPPNPVYVGDNVPYDLRVTNAGPASASSVALRVVVPTDGVNLLGDFVPGASDPRCALTNSLISCDLSPLAKDAPTTVRIVLRPLVETRFVVVAEVVSSPETDPTPTNVVNTINDAVNRPVTLTVEKNGSGGGTISSVPAGITCGPNCSASYTLGTAVTLTATPDPGSTFSGWGAGCAGTGPCTVLMDAPHFVLAAFIGSADLAISMADTPDPVIVGQDLTYTLQITNNGPARASIITVRDVLPPTVTFVSAPNCYFTGGVVTCDLVPMEAGTTITRTIVVRPTTAGSVANVAEVDAGLETDPNQGNDVTSVVTQVNPLPTQTITFDDKSGQNQALNGQYPAGIINWGSGVWFHSGPFGRFTTKSVSFSTSSRTSGSFTFVTPRRLLRLDAYNGGAGSTTVTLTCTGAATPQADKVMTLTAGQLVTINTSWTAACTGVTIKNTNGWDTNFDNLVIDGG